MRGVGRVVGETVTRTESSKKTCTAETAAGPFFFPLLQRLPGQGARAGCAQDGHARPRTRVARSRARAQRRHPASTASRMVLSLWTVSPLLHAGRTVSVRSRAACFKNAKHHETPNTKHQKHQTAPPLMKPPLIYVLFCFLPQVDHKDRGQVCMQMAMLVRCSGVVRVRCMMGTIFCVAVGGIGPRTH